MLGFSGRGIPPENQSPCPSRLMEDRCATRPSSPHCQGVERVAGTARSQEFGAFAAFEIVAFSKGVTGQVHNIRLWSDFPYFTVTLLEKLFSPFKNLAKLSVSGISSFYFPSSISFCFKWREFFKQSGTSSSISLIHWHSNLHWWVGALQKDLHTKLKPGKSSYLQGIFNSRYFSLTS